MNSPDVADVESPPRRAVDRLRQPRRRKLVGLTPLTLSSFWNVFQPTAMAVLLLLLSLLVLVVVVHDYDVDS